MLRDVNGFPLDNQSVYKNGSDTAYAYAYDDNGFIMAHMRRMDGLTSSTIKKLLALFKKLLISTQMNPHFISTMQRSFETKML